MALPDCPLCADNIRIAACNENKGPGKADNDEIGFCILPCVCAGAYQNQNLIHKEQEKGRHDNSHHDTAPHTERTHCSGIFFPSFTHGPGDDGSSTDAENGSYCRKQQEHRRRQRNSSHLQIIISLADKESVCNTALRTGAFSKTSIDLFESMFASISIARYCFAQRYTR